MGRAGNPARITARTGASRISARARIKANHPVSTGLIIPGRNAAIRKASASSPAKTDIRIKVMARDPASEGTGARTAAGTGK